MNRDFTRYQRLPTLDTLVLLSESPEIGGETKSFTISSRRRSLFPLPEGEGQGEGERVAASRQAQSVNSPRA